MLRKIAVPVSTGVSRRSSFDMLRMNGRRTHDELLGFSTVHPELRQRAYPFAYAYQIYPLVDAILLNNAVPLYVPIVVLLITGAKTPRKLWWGVIISFIGVALVLHPGPQLFQLNSFIGLASGVLAAIAIVQIRVLSKTGTTTQMFFCYFLVDTLLLAYLHFYSGAHPRFENLVVIRQDIGILACSIKYAPPYLRACAR